MKSRRGFAIQRLMNAMRQAHADGWFIVFVTLTLADDRLEAFFDNPNALRDYFRDVGRMVPLCPSQFATRRTLFHVLVGCRLLMLKVSRLKLPVIWLLVSMWLNTLTKSQIWTLLLKV